MIPSPSCVQYLRGRSTWIPHFLFKGTALVENSRKDTLYMISVSLAQTWMSVAPSSAPLWMIDLSNAHPLNAVGYLTRCFSSLTFFLIIPFFRKATTFPESAYNGVDVLIAFLSTSSGCSVPICRSCFQTFRPWTGLKSVFFCSSPSCPTVLPWIMPRFLQ